MCELLILNIRKQNLITINPHFSLILGVVQRSLPFIADVP